MILVAGKKTAFSVLKKPNANICVFILILTRKCYFPQPL